MIYHKPRQVSKTEVPNYFLEMLSSVLWDTLYKKLVFTNFWKVNLDKCHGQVNAYYSSLNQEALVPIAVDEIQMICLALPSLLWLLNSFCSS